METSKTLAQAPSETQSELATGMQRLSAVLRRLLADRDDIYNDGDDEPHFSESADWQDFLAYDDKGGR